MNLWLGALGGMPVSRSLVSRYNNLAPPLSLCGWLHRALTLAARIRKLQRDDTGEWHPLDQAVSATAPFLGSLGLDETAATTLSKALYGPYSSLWSLLLVSSASSHLGLRVFQIHGPVGAGKSF